MPLNAFDIFLLALDYILLVCEPVYLQLHRKLGRILPQSDYCDAHKLWLRQPADYANIIAQSQNVGAKRSTKDKSTRSRLWCQLEREIRDYQQLRCDCQLAVGATTQSGNGRRQQLIWSCRSRVQRWSRLLASAALQLAHRRHWLSARLACDEPSGRQLSWMNHDVALVDCRSPAPADSQHDSANFKISLRRTTGPVALIRTVPLAAGARGHLRPIELSGAADEQPLVCLAKFCSELEAKRDEDRAKLVFRSLQRCEQMGELCRLFELLAALLECAALLEPTGRILDAEPDDDLWLRRWQFANQRPQLTRFALFLMLVGYFNSKEAAEIRRQFSDCLAVRHLIAFTGQFGGRPDELLLVRPNERTGEMEIATSAVIQATNETSGGGGSSSSSSSAASRLVIVDPTEKEAAEGEDADELSVRGELWLEMSNLLAEIGAKLAEEKKMCSMLLQRQPGEEEAAPSLLAELFTFCSQRRSESVSESIWRKRILSSPSTSSSTDDSEIEREEAENSPVRCDDDAAPLTRRIKCSSWRRRRRQDEEQEHGDSEQEQEPEPEAAGGLSSRVANNVVCLNLLSFYSRHRRILRNLFYLGLFLGARSLLLRHLMGWQHELKLQAHDDLLQLKRTIFQRDFQPQAQFERPAARGRRQQPAKTLAEDEIFEQSASNDEATRQPPPPPPIEQHDDAIGKVMQTIMLEMMTRRMGGANLDELAAKLAADGADQLTGDQLGRLFAELANAGDQDDELDDDDDEQEDEQENYF